MFGLGTQNTHYNYYQQDKHNTWPAGLYYNCIWQSYKHSHTHMPVHAAHACAHTHRGKRKDILQCQIMLWVNISAHFVTTQLQNLQALHQLWHLLSSCQGIIHAATALPNMTPAEVTCSLHLRLKESRLRKGDGDGVHRKKNKSLVVFEYLQFSESLNRSVFWAFLNATHLSAAFIQRKGQAVSQFRCSVAEDPNPVFVCVYVCVCMWCVCVCVCMHACVCVCMHMCWSFGQQLTARFQFLDVPILLIYRDAWGSQ